MEILQKAKMTYKAHILIRTHKRPESFARCIASIKSQNYPYYQIHVVTDDMQSMDYCREFNPLFIQKEEKQAKQRLNGCLYFPQNLYINELYKDITDGFCVHLDDDDMLTYEYSLQRIANELQKFKAVFWRVNIEGVLVPHNENWKTHPVKADISGIGIAYDHEFKEFLYWDRYKQADYRNASRLYDITPVGWIDEVLTKTQTTNHSGQSFEQHTFSILIVIPLWKRSVLFEQTSKRLNDFIKAKPANYTIQVLAICSPEDNEFKKLQSICKRNNYFVCTYKNDPLGEKLNAGVNLAVNNFSFDYIMQLGSDDVILPKAWINIMQCINEKCYFFGADGFYCIDHKLQRAIKMKFESVVSGAGRFIHIDLLKRVFQKSDLYTSERTSGLDTDSQERIYWFTGQKQHICEGLSDYIVDIKDNNNINDFQMYEFCDLSSSVSYSAIKRKFKL
jgi:hypothetical protein